MRHFLILEPITKLLTLIQSSRCPFLLRLLAYLFGYVRACGVRTGKFVRKMVAKITDFPRARSFAVAFLILWIMPTTIFGGYSRVSGHWSPEQYVPTCSVQEHYDKGYQALTSESWEEALVHFMVIFYHYRETPFYADALYHGAICYFHQSEVDLANKQFDRYLELGGKLKYFENVFDYKLAIANFYAQGIKKHLFGVEKLPKWASAKKDALVLYDEIIAALPSKEVAAAALYQKADLLRAKRDYSLSIEALQTLTRRFPKHSLAAESFLRISEIYLEQSKRESQNPDLIALAQINMQRFAKSFPLDERVVHIKGNLLAMQEVYAQSLYDTGRFYERRKKSKASAIYYEDTIQKYPETVAAKKCRDRLAQMEKKLSFAGTPKAVI